MLHSLFFFLIQICIPLLGRHSRKIDTNLLQKKLVVVVYDPTMQIAYYKFLILCANMYL